MENKILKLTKLWYEYVNKDHHKDRDCHWYIKTVYSYGDKPYYTIEHYGYIYPRENLTHYKTYEAAEKALYREILKAFRQELKWAKDAINRPSKYDEIQEAQARWLVKNYKEE